MAWAERLPNGKWRGGWRLPDDTKVYTNKKTHPEHPYARKRDALEAAQEAEVKARRQAAARKGNVSATITWGEWWAILSPEYPHSDTGRTVAGIVNKYLMPRWENEPLNTVENRDAKSWAMDLLIGREVSYVRRIYGVFRWSINQAVDKGVLTASPCVGITLPKPPKKTKTFIDEPYMALVGPHLKPWFRDITELAFETGLRPGEVGGLHADVCDLDSGWLDVSKVLIGRSDVIRPWPKDVDSRRVPLTSKAVEIIRRNLDGRDPHAGCGMPHIGGKTCRSILVIVNKQGHRITPGAWWAAMDRAAKRAKIPRRCTYDARRGFGTRAGHGGMDAFDLADIMGHADVRQTQEYVQSSPQARDRLRKALGETTPLTVVDGAQSDRLDRPDDEQRNGKGRRHA